MAGSMAAIARLAAVLAAIVAVSACAGRWQATTPGRITDPSGRVSVALPGGWLRDSSVEHALVVTRQGLSLQNIVVAFEEHGAPRALLGRHTYEGIQAEELQRALLDAVGADPARESVEVVESTRTVVAGLPAARLLVRGADPGGLLYRYMMVGVATQDGVMRFSYEAPEIHYFEQDLEAFEAVVASARLSQ